MYYIEGVNLGYEVCKNKMAAPMGLSTFNSGAAPFGNFINYYTFNPPEKRIDFLPKDLLQVISGESRKKSVTVLDIGCNAGVGKFT